MAMVELTIRQATRRELPRVCMRCGEPAVLYRHVTLHWYPWWVRIWFYPSMLAYFLPFLVLGAVFGRRIALRAPLCDLDRNHWRWRTVALFVGLATSILTFAAGTGVAFDLAARFKNSPKMAQEIELLGILIILLAYVFLFAVIVAHQILRYTSIYAKQITKNEVLLNGVSPIFVAALQAAQSGLPGGPRIGESDQTSQEGAPLPSLGRIP